MDCLYYGIQFYCLTRLICHCHNFYIGSLRISAETSIMSCCIAIIVSIPLSSAVSFSPFIYTFPRADNCHGYQPILYKINDTIFRFPSKVIATFTFESSMQRNSCKVWVILDHRKMSEKYFSLNVIRQFFQITFSRWRKFQDEFHNQFSENSFCNSSRLKNFFPFLRSFITCCVRLFT